MDNEVKASPTLFQVVEQCVDACPVTHVTGQNDIGPQLLCKWPDPLQQRVTLIGKRQFCALIRQGFRNAPGNRFIVGKPHDKPAFSCH